MKSDSTPRARIGLDPGDTGTASDMDFDDIVFQVEGLKLVGFQKSARRRFYFW